MFSILFFFVVVSLDRRKEKGLMCTHFGLILEIGKTFYCGLRNMAMAILGDLTKRDIHWIPTIKVKAM